MVTDIKRLYETLKPRLDALEGRRKALRNLIIGGLVSVGLGVGSCVTAIDLPQSIAELPQSRFAPAAFAALALFLVGVAFSRFLIPGITGFANYRARFKADVAAEVFKAAQPGMKYFPERLIKREVYAASRLFRTSLSKFTGDDLLQGVVGETPFECSELIASYEIGGGDDHKTVNVLRGLFFRIDFDLPLLGHTVVQPPKAPGGDRSGMERVPVGRAFDEHFDVWSTHPSEVQDILSIRVQKGLLELNERVASPLHLAFGNRVAYAAIDYQKPLFEPGIASSLREADLAAFAAPLDIADDVVRALALESGRRSPADSGFHIGGFTVSGLEELSKRVTRGGDVEFHELVDMAEKTAGAEAPPEAQPERLYSVIEGDGSEFIVKYRVTLGTLVTIAVWMTLTPLLAAAAWNWIDPAGGERILSFVEARSGWVHMFLSEMFPSPTAFFFIVLFFWWLFWTSLRHRPVSLTIGADGVRTRMLLALFANSLPMSAIRGVKGAQRRIHIVRSDRGLLRSFQTASPLLPNEMETAWVAKQILVALKRSGWRPPS